MADLHIAAWYPIEALFFTSAEIQIATAALAYC